MRRKANRKADCALRVSRLHFRRSQATRLAAVPSAKAQHARLGVLAEPPPLFIRMHTAVSGVVQRTRGRDVQEAFRGQKCQIDLHTTF